MKAYEQKVESFLETLLFLVHVTSGQPARGPEILSLRHSNSQVGAHRNIFVEEGVVSTVTRYHKGYSVTGSFKIIHRFLPREVGEMLVYYIWLVLPFRQQLDGLTSQRHERPSPFIWAHKNDFKKHWDTAHLTKVISDAFQPLVEGKIGVADYRHIAIAVAREHLPHCGFKRDFEAEDAYIDLQAGHNSTTAGALYARQMQDGRGHVEGMKRKYKQASRDWHAFLGLLASSRRARVNMRLGQGAIFQIESQTEAMGEETEQAEIEEARIEELEIGEAAIEEAQVQEAPIRRRKVRRAMREESDSEVSGGQSMRKKGRLSRRPAAGD